MITHRSDLHVNHLLSALPRGEWETLAQHFELVRLRAGELLTDSGQRIVHVYFPTTAVVSLLSLLEDGATVEIAAVGNEGLVGIPVVTGGDTMPSRVEVRSPGMAYRIPARLLRGELPNSSMGRRLEPEPLLALSAASKASISAWPASPVSSRAAAHSSARAWSSAEVMSFSLAILSSTGNQFGV